MPQLFRMGGYRIYFWVNEGDPIEPVHVHISTGAPSGNSTKVWITRAGGCLLCHNNSHIPKHILHNIMLAIETQSESIIEEWEKYFGQASYYC